MLQVFQRDASNTVWASSANI
ncbi:hypothetical protein AZE42_14032 [Rhizopogon vesiculosus]|uniref:Uncharacterized protein n=1 Tax=Rhizopogon vesiculosus TaxID=180088 RepID=A0A1J8QIB0_9AGAM|nr:hypothetical protein AZE42_14032 [Rhizopogon vesiculosus]